MLNTITHGDDNGETPLLIAHGLFGSARNWGVIAKRLSTERQVIVADMRNHGNSPWFDSHNYHDLADDLAQLIEQPIHLLGHSMGGKAAMVLASTRPELVESLIVADIAPVPYQHTQMDPINAMRRVDLSIVETRSDAKTQITGVEPGLPDFLLQSLNIKEKRWKLNLDVLEAEMTKIVGFPENLATTNVPTLFLSGATSDYVKSEYRQHIREIFTAARFAKIPGAGHWLHAEEPRKFQAAVAAFLKMAH